MELLERYNNLKSKVVERKEDFEKLMEFVETQTVYLTTPASRNYHLSIPQGLLEHSVNVAENLLKIKNTLDPSISDESCVIVALLHDLGKVGMPGNPQYIENEPTEKQKKWGYPASTPYRFNEELTYLSVPIRSIFLIGDKIKLTDEEAQAIVYHDGQYADDNKSAKGKECNLLLMLHYADSWSAFVTEKGK